MGASKQNIDFTNVKEGGSFNKKHQREGDYKAKITKVQDAKKKDGGAPMWLFTIQAGTGTYPYYCSFEENVLWKIRNLCVAAGLNVPKKRVAVDPNKLVNKFIGITLEDDEYDGKVNSSVASVFPTSELESMEDEGSSDDDDDDDDDDDTPTPSSSDDDDDDDDDEPTEAPQGKKGKKDKAGKKGKKSKDASELEELDLDEI